MACVARRRRRSTVVRPTVAEFATTCGFAMTDRTALRNLGRTAEKWRDLAQSRRDYFRELRGRWRRFYHRGASQSSVILNMAPMLGPVAMRLLRSL